MKNVFFIFVISTVIVSGCRKETVPKINDCDIASVTNQGTGEKLVSRTYTSQENNESTEVYFYSDENQVIRIENEVRNILLTFKYENDLLVESRRGNLDEYMSLKDTFIYNEDGLLELYYNIRIDSSLNQGSQQFFEYYYDDQNILIETKSYNDSNLDSFSIFKYEWSNGNISNIKTYFSNDVLRTERLYKYDNGANYLKLSMDGPFLPTFWNENNLISSWTIDHANIGTENCEDCCKSHEYNLNNLPTRIDRNLGYYTFTYE